MAQGFNRDAEFDRARAEIARLLMPGMLGFYTHFEATEIFAVRDEERIPFNVFSVLVAEEHEADATKEPHFLGGRIRLKTLKGWMFGIQRYVRPITELLPVFDHLRQAEEWRPSGKRLHVGSLVPVPTQFAPADSTESAPWNNVLKNNFWCGSHLVEWADAEKTSLRALFEDPPRLQELSEAVQREVPIRLASLSDRLGNIVLQVPGDVLVAVFAKAHNGNASVNVRWHPKATPRPLRVSCEMQFDNIVTAFASGVLLGAELTLPMADGRGTLRGILWDDEHQIVVAATASTGFINTFGWNMRVVDNEPRVFTLRRRDGSEDQVRVGLSISTYHEVKAPGPDRGEKWTHQRMYRAEAAALVRSRRFVQYNPTSGSSDTEHEKALDDIRALLNEFGEKGASLWDPYLSADDILRTLFYCPHNGAELRALTAGQEYVGGPIPRPTLASLRRQAVEWLGQWFWPPPPQPTFAERQRSVFAAANSNFRGLRLEYRIRTGSAGWPFHDRFLIFPGKEDASARAWSLGTSVNSLGKRHHILQEVDDGQLVMDAFNGLWGELDTPEHLVWKIPP